MAQKSLSRFNRLNVSMTWESEIQTNNYHWLSLKIYFFFKFYITYVFQALHYNFFNLWAPILQINIFSEFTITNFTKKGFKTSNHRLKVVDISSVFFNILIVYLLRFFSNSHIYIIFNNRKILKKFKKISWDNLQYYYKYTLTNFSYSTVY